MKKLLTMLLLLALAGGLFAGCKPDESTSNESKPETSGTSGESSRAVADVPYNSLGKKVITILTTATNADVKTSEFGYGEELEDSTINTAVQERNNKVEELLDIVFVEELVVDGNRFPGGLVKERVELAMNTGTDTFQLVVPSLYNCGAIAAIGGFYDLMSFEYLHNLSAPWWDQNFIDDLNIDNKMFFITGDIGIQTRNSLTVCFFNKKMFKDEELGEPYQLVKEYKWTFDRLIELSKQVKQDLNDDGKITYDDIFGLGGQNDLGWAMFYGSGERIASKGSDGYPKLTMYNTRSTGVLDKMLTLMTNKDYFVSANDYFGISNTPTDLVVAGFIEGRGLLFAEGLAIVEKLREMSHEMDFGILPIPLYNEEQTQYQHMVNPWSGNAVGIPSYLSHAEAEIASIVLEVLGAESKNYITPAFYERALKKQAARDEESQEMLDIIFSAVGADMGHVYDWGKLGSNVLHKSVEGKLIGQFQSTYEQYADAAQKALDDTVQAFKDLS